MSDKRNVRSPVVAAVVALSLWSTAAEAQLRNVSTRGFVGTSDTVMIPGIIIEKEPRDIVVRALGPTLGAHYNVQGALANPALELRDGHGTLIAANDDWQQDANAGYVAQLGLAPGNQLEAAIYRRQLPPGNYTAIVSGGGGIGVLLGTN